ncbi:MAG: radical SAM protein [Candidatus Aminicenantes bacterium]|jgi:radical SAM superfamily enzyme YgiQ (UPF0313 family)
MLDQNKILFCSLVPEHFGGIYLALVELKSYLLHKKVNFTFDHIQAYIESSTYEIVSGILARGARIIGFSVYLWNHEKIISIARQVKKRQKDVLIIVGGAIPTYQADEMLQECAAFDIAVQGQGEETLLQLLQHIEKNNFDFTRIPSVVYRKEPGAAVLQNPYRDNCDIANHHYPLLTDDLEGLPIVYFETARGCMFKCKYCAYRLNFHGRSIVKYYPVEKVFTDLENIFKLQAVKQLILFDTNPVYAKARKHRDRGLRIIRYINQLNQKRVEKGLNSIQIEVDTQPDDLDDEIIEELKRLNAHIYSFGLQSIDPTVLRLSNRRFNKEKFIENTRKLQQKSGARIYIEIIYGLPGDSLEKFKQSLEFVLSAIQPYFIYTYHFKLLPGSLFWEERGQYNWFYNEKPPYNVISTETFSKEDFRRAGHISGFIRLVYIMFRGIKNTVDKYFNHNKVFVYEKIMDDIFDRHSDFFDLENFKEENVYAVIKKLRDDANARQRYQMKKEMRKIIEEEKSNDKGK